MLGPAQRDEHVVALFHPGAGPGFPAFQPDAQVGGEPQRRVGVGLLGGAGDGLAVGVGGVLPGGADAVVVERRLAAHHQLDGAADAAHRAQQDVLGVPVHRGAAVGARASLQVVPGAHDQRVPYDQPSRVGLPGGFHDQAAGQVSAGRRDGHAVGSQPEMAGAAVQDRPEHARGVRSGHTHPFHRPGRRDQAGGFPVGQECVVGDRGKRVPQGCVGSKRPGCAQVDRRLHRHRGGCAEGFLGHGVGRLVVGLSVQNHLDIIDCAAALRPTFRPRGKVGVLFPSP